MGKFNLNQSKLSFQEFKEGFMEREEFTESGLCEIIGSDLNYIFVPYVFDGMEWVGYFILSLSDGYAFVPVYEVQSRGGFEQIDEIGIKMFDLESDEDKQLLMDSFEKITKAKQGLQTLLNTK